MIRAQGREIATGRRRRPCREFRGTLETRPPTRSRPRREPSADGSPLRPPLLSSFHPHPLSLHSSPTFLARDTRRSRAIILQNVRETEIF